MASNTSVNVLAPIRRRWAFSLENACSIGLRSGEYVVAIEATYADMRQTEPPPTKVSGYSVFGAPSAQRRIIFRLKSEASNQFVESEVAWFYEPDSFRPLARQAGGELLYILTDHLGTPKEMVDEGVQVLDKPWLDLTAPMGNLTPTLGAFAYDPERSV